MWIRNHSASYIVAFLLFFFSLPFSEASEQVIINGTDDDLSNSATEFGSIMGMPPTTWGTNERQRAGVIPTDGRFYNLRVKLTGAPGAGTSYAFSVRKGLAESGITCTIADAATTCEDVTNKATFLTSADDFVGFRVVPSGTPAVADARWSVMFQPATRGNTILMGGTAGNNLATDGSTEFLPLHGQAPTDTTEFDVETLSPLAGTVKNLFIRINSTPGAGNSYVFTVRKNSTNQSLTCTIADTDLTCNDTSNSFTIAAADAIALQVVSVSTPTARFAAWGVVVKPDTEGEFIMALSSDDALNNAATEYGWGSAADFNWSATETDRESMGQVMTLQRLQVELSEDPGGVGNRYRFTVRNNAGNTSLQCDVNGGLPGSDFCNDTGTTDAVAAFDVLGLEVSLVGTPTATPKAHISVKGFITPKPIAGAVMNVD